MAQANHVAQDGYQLVLATRSVTKNFQKD
jgi:hypothetical protein